MQKTGNFLIDFMPKTIVPLDSAYVFRLYATYYNALRIFYQGFVDSINDLKKSGIARFFIYLE